MRKAFAAAVRAAGLDTPNHAARAPPHSGNVVQNGGDRRHAPDGAEAEIPSQKRIGPRMARSNQSRVRVR
jgi:hypothetical protein